MFNAIEELDRLVKEKTALPKAKLEKMSFFSETFLINFKEFLSPDSHNYRSPLNPLFSFEFEFKSISFYIQPGVLSFRDGILPFLRFFILHPSPPSDSPILIVDESFSSLVPEEWRARVLLRKTYALHLQPEKIKNKILIFVSPDQSALPMDLLENELEKLKDNINANDDLLVLFSSTRTRWQGDAVYHDQWGYKVLQKMTEALSAHKIEIINYNEFLKMDLGGFRFVQVNPLKLYFSDSYLHHEASQRGAVELYASATSQKNFLPLSLNHGFVFHQNFDDYRGSAKEKWRECFLKAEEKCVTTEQYKNISSAFFPDEFVKWGEGIARAIYNETRKLK